MEQIELQQRIIETADEYHFTAEDQWSQALELEPTDDESLFEFLRLARTALRFYLRAYLVLDLIETDDEQDLEDLLELVAEEEQELADFFQKNHVAEVLNEEGGYEFSRLFSIAESVRAVLLQRSNDLAATLNSRFSESASS